MKHNTKRNERKDNPSGEHMDRFDEFCGPLLSQQLTSKRQSIDEEKISSNDV